MQAIAIVGLYAALALIGIGVVLILWRIVDRLSRIVDRVIARFWP